MFQGSICTFAIIFLQCVTFFVAQVFGSCAEDDGTAKHNQSRPYRYAYPWVALVTALEQNNMKTCGGALVSEQHAISSSSCIFGISETVNVPTVLVILGADRLDDYKERLVRQATALTFGHEWRGDVDYGNGSFMAFRHDIAMLRFDTTVPFSKSVKPVRLPPTTFDLPKNAHLTIMHWGDVRFVTRKKVRYRTQRACVELVDADNCALGDFNPKPGEYFCVMKDDRFTSGDSGSPVTFLESDNKHTLVGIVAFGDPTPKTGYILTNIFNYRRQIQQELIKREPRERSNFPKKSQPVSV